MNIKSQMIFASQYDPQLEQKCMVCEGSGRVVEINENNKPETVPCINCGGEGFTE
jgi:DnaJ-class molecular chaperone